MDCFWKGPARLCHGSLQAGARGGQPPFRQLAMGSLEDMILRAEARVLDAGTAERDAIFIDAGGQTILSWPEIERLRRSPRFPVEI